MHEKRNNSHRTRFQKGKSGNSKGRPKRSTATASPIDAELDQLITVTENGKRMKISKRQAAAKQLVNKAVGGDEKALRLILPKLELYIKETERVRSESVGQEPVSLEEASRLYLQEIKGEV